MSNILRFPKSANCPSKPRSAIASTVQPRLIFPNWSLRAQEIARRNIGIVLLDLERVLLKCREAISKIPAQDPAGKRKLEAELRAIERARIEAGRRPPACDAEPPSDREGG